MDIKSEKVRIVTEQGSKVVKTKDAMKEAQDKELDLIVLNDSVEIPICKIGDYSKYLYDQKKKEKENKKKNKPIEVKEIKISDSTQTNDLKTKAKLIDKFLMNGNKVKISIRYKGRSIKQIKEGPQKIQNLMDFINNDYIIDTPMKTNNNIVTITIFQK